MLVTLIGFIDLEHWLQLVCI